MIITTGPKLAYSSRYGLQSHSLSLFSQRITAHDLPSPNKVRSIKDGIMRRPAFR